MSKTERYNEIEYKWGDDRPKPIAGEMQVIVQRDEVVAVDFLCPCGCGHSCFTPIVSSMYKRGENPACWDYHTAGRMISPSVRWLSGCKAHFFIRADGIVEWCSDSGR